MIALASDQVIAAADVLAEMATGPDPIEREEIGNVVAMLRAAWKTLRPMEVCVAERIAETRIVDLRRGLVLIEGGRSGR